MSYCPSCSRVFHKQHFCLLITAGAYACQQNEQSYNFVKQSQMFLSLYGDRDLSIQCCVSLLFYHYSRKHKWSVLLVYQGVLPLIKWRELRSALGLLLSNSTSDSALVLLIVSHLQRPILPTYLLQICCSHSAECRQAGPSPSFISYRVH